MRHVLNADRANLHGHFSSELGPVLEIESGDTVCFTCLDAGWGLEPHKAETRDRLEVEPRDPTLDSGHCLTGPVAIRDAQPGDVLAVRIDGIELGEWGTTYVGGWKCEWNDRLGVSDDGQLFPWTFAPDGKTATNSFGDTVSLRPFMGIYGMPPAEPGVHSTVPPRRTGGNIDCKELCAGTTLYLPVEVAAGLFSTGDGHAVQGDGEICITAIECPMASVELTFDLIKGWELELPVAKTPTAWVALAFHADLDEAVLLATNSMVSLMQREFGFTRHRALALASLTVDFRITQVVNGVKGVHAVLPFDAIRYGKVTNSVPTGKRRLNSFSSNSSKWMESRIVSL